MRFYRLSHPFDPEGLLLHFPLYRGMRGLTVIVFVGRKVHRNELWLVKLFKEYRLDDVW